MTEITNVRWMADAASIGAALQSARHVRSTDEPHLRGWIERWAQCESPPALFPAIDRRCDSFSQWWSRTSSGLHSAAQLLRTHPVPEG